METMEISQKQISGFLRLGLSSIVLCLERKRLASEVCPERGSWKGQEIPPTILSTIVPWHEECIFTRKS
ncbi:hypothetical protein M0802_016124 [Mischocyttarus mexicanus]|nr:hypothetical protein M0802_016124 [Mischocyttarus mexicanus]